MVSLSGSLSSAGPTPMLDECQRKHRAGAIWRTHATSLQPELCSWDIETYRHWMKTIDENSGETLEERGIEKHSLHVYSYDTEVDTTSPSLWYTLMMLRASSTQPRAAT